MVLQVVFAGEDSIRGHKNAGEKSSLERKVCV